jgi:hypothetical protein
MENLHPVAQVTVIIVTGIFACILCLSALTTFFDKK